MTTQIVIDTGRASALHSGLGQVVLGFANALAAVPSGDFAFTFLLHKNLLPLFRERFDFELLSAGAHRRALPGLFAAGDLWHLLNPDSRSVPLRHPRIVTTIHDIRILAAKHGKQRQRYRRGLQRILDRSVGLTAISSFTRSAMRDSFHLPNVPFAVIPNGIWVPDSVSGEPATKIGKPYLLAVGLFEEKKRLDRLVEMMQFLPRFELCLVGFNHNAYGENLRLLVKRLGLEDRVKLAGVVDEEEKWRLYAECEALVFPSDLEGFGLPSLEAMAMGRPAFLSRDGALPEVGGDLAFYFTSLEPAAMAKTVEDGLSNDAAKQSPRRREYARRFTWHNAVQRYLEFYRQVLGLPPTPLSGGSLAE